jgi:hypothetical protein
MTSQQLQGQLQTQHSVDTIIQFNSVRVYLRANSTTHKQITEVSTSKRKKQQNKN